jgi:hypothetical protein
MKYLSMKNRKTIIGISISLVCLILVLISYHNARNKADGIMGPFLKDGLYYYGTSFQPVTFIRDNDNKIKKWWGPSWYVSYDAKTEMIVQPFSIRVNLWGRIIATNPNNLIEEIIPKYLIPKLDKII